MNVSRRGRNFSHSSVAAAALLILAACRGETPETPPLNVGTPGLHVVSGSGQTAVVQTVLPAPIVVELRDSVGLPLTGVVVRFESEPRPTSQLSEVPVLLCSGSPTCIDQLAVYTATTDANGQVAVGAITGRKSGRGLVRIYAPTVGKPDSAVFQVLPGASFRIRAPASDTLLTIGAPATLCGVLLDANGNVQSPGPTMTAGTGNVFTFNPGTCVVTPRELGTQWLYYRSGPLEDSTRVRVLPAGRIVVWAGGESIRLVNLDGTGLRILSQTVNTGLGAFPNFDAARQRVTWQSGFNTVPFPTNAITIIDTSGAPRRDIDPISSGFTEILCTRQLADGTVLVFGERGNQTGLFSVSTSNVVSLVRALPAHLVSTGLADITHDGTRVAFIAFDKNTQTISMHTMVGATGAIATLDSAAAAPRWSLQDDRIAYLSGPVVGNQLRTTVAVVNANGQNKRTIASGVFDPGIAWSPDGTYLIARYSDGQGGTLNVFRISDGASLPLVLPNVPSPRQPDWR